MVVTTCTSDVVNNLVKITSLFLLFFTKPWFRESGENSLKPRTKHSVLYIYFLKTEIVIFYFSSNVNSQRAYVKKSFLSQILHPTFKPKRWETCLSPDLHLKAFFSSDFDKSFQIKARVASQNTRSVEALINEVPCTDDRERQIIGRYIVILTYGWV